MHQIHEGDPQHKELDLWEFHEAGDSRVVPNAAVLCHYVFSPSTEQVIFFQNRSGPGGEIRAYGPDGRFVWYEVPNKRPKDYGLLVGLFAKIERQGKLIVYR